MTQNKCLLVDYGVGNIFSITQAIEACGFDVELSSDVKKIRNASHVILPGVGAFSHAKDKLDAFQLTEPLRIFAQNGGFLLGICVGMQLLFSEGFEYGTHKGLNIIRGKVDSIKKRAPSMRVPVIGWQFVEVMTDNALFADIEKQNYYFVHSYECLPEDDGLVSGCVPLDDIEICASVTQGHVSGVQFHPEKSGAAGLKLLHNFMSQK